MRNFGKPESSLQPVAKGRILRPSAEAIRELPLGREAAKNSAASAAQRLAYWNAGSADYRWQQIATANTGLTSVPGYRAVTLMILFVNGDGEPFGIVEWRHTRTASRWFGWASRRLQVIVLLPCQM